MNLSRENNFDLIRLLAALQVVFWHGREHLGFQGTIANYVVNMLGYFPGVPIFFTISGFLIYAAYDRNKNLQLYFRNRILRIYPALWVCLVVTILLLLFFGFVNSQTAVSPAFIVWLSTQLSFFQFYTPDFLRGFGVSTPNGSLWTIPIEISFYLFIPFLVWIKQKNWFNNNLLLVLIMALSLFYNHWYNTNYRAQTSPSVAVKLMGLNLLPYLFYFLLGSFTYMNWESVRKWYEGKGLAWLIFYILYCASFSVWLGKFSPGYWPNIFGLVAVIILSQTVLALAYTMKNVSQKILKRNDISYGVYLYHMPIINAIVQLRYKEDTYSFVIAISLTIFMAFLSWKLVEQPILALKKMNPKK